MPSPIDLRLATHHLLLSFDPEHGIVGKFMCDDDDCPGTSWLNSQGAQHWHRHYSGSRNADPASGPIVLSRTDAERWTWRFHQPGTFVRYIERNESEDEKWSFWLQREGNTEALEQLAAILQQIESRDGRDDFDSYELAADDIETGPDVDLLYEYGSSDYFDQHTKLTGRLVLPDQLTADTLRKGGIRKLFQKWAD